MIQHKNVAPRQRGRLLRHARVRKKIRGTAERPRLVVFRSLKYIYAQVIDDEKGHTIAAASSLEPALRNSLPKTDNIEAARAVGRLIAERAIDAGVRHVVFDRGGYKYHGRVKALADAAREGGLEF
ncbi:MAG: 50S ribosomal protein L18 [Armatimonadota bacterium]|nr:MAG: 50S ribosomal protein L18 [Armatimonadota bacterium]